MAWQKVGSYGTCEVPLRDLRKSQVFVATGFLTHHK